MGAGGLILLWGASRETTTGSKGLTKRIKEIYSIICFHRVALNTKLVLTGVMTRFPSLLTSIVAWFRDTRLSTT